MRTREEIVKGYTFLSGESPLAQYIQGFTENGETPWIARVNLSTMIGETTDRPCRLVKIHHFEFVDEESTPLWVKEELERKGIKVEVL